MIFFQNWTQSKLISILSNLVVLPMLVVELDLKEFACSTLDWTIFEKLQCSQETPRGLHLENLITILLSNFHLVTFNLNKFPCQGDLYITILLVPNKCVNYFIICSQFPNPIVGSFFSFPTFE